MKSSTMKMLLNFDAWPDRWVDIGLYAAVFALGALAVETVHTIRPLLAS